MASSRRADKIDPSLFPEVPEDLKDFPELKVDAKKVLDEACRQRVMLNAESKGPIKLRSHRYFPRAKDFERDELGNPITSSLRGPDKLEAKEQFRRERLVAIEEMKFLREEVTACYRRDPANFRETCKPLAKAYMQLYNTPGYGMLKPPSYFF